jgi:hypothetical protein
MQLGQRVVMVAVTTQLGHENVGSPRLDQWRYDFAEGPKLEVVTGERWERQIDLGSSWVTGAAVSDAPTARTVASCICGKIGLSPGPNPNGHQGPSSPCPARRTTSKYGAPCTRSSSLSDASRARVSVTRSPSTIP